MFNSVGKYYCISNSTKDVIITEGRFF